MIDSLDVKEEKKAVLNNINNNILYSEKEVENNESMELEKVTKNEIFQNEKIEENENVRYETFMIASRNSNRNYNNDNDNNNKNDSNNDEQDRMYSDMYGCDVLSYADHDSYHTETQTQTQTQSDSSSYSPLETLAISGIRLDTDLHTSGSSDFLQLALKLFERYTINPLSH